MADLKRIAAFKSESFREAHAAVRSLESVLDSESTTVRRFQAIRDCESILRTNRLEVDRVSSDSRNIFLPSLGLFVLVVSFTTNTFFLFWIFLVIIVLRGIYYLSLLTEKKPEYLVLFERLEGLRKQEQIQIRQQEQNNALQSLLLRKDEASHYLLQNGESPEALTLFVKTCRDYYCVLHNNSLSTIEIEALVQTDITGIKKHEHTTYLGDHNDFRRTVANTSYITQQADESEVVNPNILTKRILMALEPNEFMLARCLTIPQLLSLIPASRELVESTLNGLQMEDIIIIDNQSNGSVCYRLNNNN